MLFCVLVRHPHPSLPPLLDGVAAYVLRMDCGGDGAVELTHYVCQKVTKWSLLCQKLGCVLLRNADEEQYALHHTQCNAAFLTHTHYTTSQYTLTNSSFMPSEHKFFTKLEMRTLGGSPGFSQAAKGPE